MWLVIKKKDKTHCPSCHATVMLSDNDCWINLDYFEKETAFLSCTCDFKFNLEHLKASGIKTTSTPKLNISSNLNLRKEADIH